MKPEKNIPQAANTPVAHLLCVDHQDTWLGIASSIYRLFWDKRLSASVCGVVLIGNLILFPLLLHVLPCCVHNDSCKIICSCRATVLEINEHFARVQRAGLEQGFETSQSVTHFLYNLVDLVFQATDDAIYLVSSFRSTIRGLEHLQISRKASWSTRHITWHFCR